MHWLIIPGALAALYLVYRLDLLVNPNRRCWFCKGRGRHPLSRKNSWGYCWFCKGRPRRRRGARKATGRKRS